jgi:glycosyltransferase involved in cell wall biosynthesis
MRIALVVPKFPPSSIGGMEIYTLNLARVLSAHRHEVFVFYRDDRAGEGAFEMAWEERKGFYACRISRGAQSQTMSLLECFLDTFWNRDVEYAFERFLERVQPQLVHFQHLMLLSYRLLDQAKRQRLPAVLTLHDYWFLCNNSQLIWPDGQVCQGKAIGLNCARCALIGHFPRGLALGLRPAAAFLLQVRDYLMRQAALRADRLIAPSYFLMRRYVQAGFPVERMVYLENGVDVKRLRRYPRQPSPDGRLRFTYIGALAWHKGVHIAIEAFRGLSADRVILRVYGNPAMFPEYAEQLRARADPHNTFFAGLVPNDEIGTVLAETDILLVPS